MADANNGKLRLHSAAQENQADSSLYKGPGEKMELVTLEGGKIPETS